MMPRSWPTSRDRSRDEILALMSLTRRNEVRRPPPSREDPRAASMTTEFVAVRGGSCTAAESSKLRELQSDAETIRRSTSTSPTTTVRLRGVPSLRDLIVVPAGDGGRGCLRLTTPSAGVPRVGDRRGDHRVLQPARRPVVDDEGLLGRIRHR